MEAQPIVREVQNLTPLIVEVVNLRREYGVAQQAIAELRAAWEAEHQAQLADAKDLKATLEEAESSLRGEALANYAVTGNKQVAPGIVIRVTRKPIYDMGAASAWSLAHGGIAHVFDAKVFEKLVVANPSLTEAFVQIKEISIATLAKDLEPALAKEQP